MGTRSLTVVVDNCSETPKEICVLYRQFDGYPSGHGRELVDFLKGMQVVNGFSAPNPKLANGPNCLAASLVAYFKKETGGFYLYPADTRDCGEEYVYTITVNKNSIILTVVDINGDIIYDGVVDEEAWSNLKD